MEDGGILCRHIHLAVGIQRHLGFDSITCFGSYQSSLVIKLRTCLRFVRAISSTAFRIEHITAVHHILIIHVGVLADVLCVGIPYTI